ncbi:hypothetical protein F4553_003460 [Allocatelliglobosispora scoriae]|uniref:ASPIC/UnbV domain-containing protein n=1 Tax=Allocatelliglobosispora scoriae TaxID=643052 RepID=A0A841BTG6_9ACTN|nr:CRTAC1 family protein [Allocatelliglobosispora scoriae]MBB5870081.1 hypothetical protein [Allocatelliglobosispora scoriae]
MSATHGWLRRQLPGIIGLALVVGLFFVVRLPSASASERADIASHYAFTPMSIDLPGGYPQQTIRRVNQEYKHIDAWISSVGAGIAMNDLDGDGLANDLCLTDPRTDQAIVAPAPGKGQARYRSFALNPGDLPMSGTKMAPMGCAPGDFNEDGRMDLLVYMWGRTPILYLARANSFGLTAATYRAVELVPSSPGATYNGPLWNTNAVAIDDFDGDGHVDIFIGNYFPHGPVLDDSVDTGVAMNDSMSNGLNGGEDYFFCWEDGTAGARPSAKFKLIDNALPEKASKGWALGAAANDLDGDLLPELYLAHDFGPDRLLYNRSSPGHLEFALVEGSRSAVVPKSKVIGHDSFKGMGVDFGDLNQDGMYDMFVSNITTSFGIEESHFMFMNEAKSQADLKSKFAEGDAPFSDESAPLNLAWSGWGWDAKMGDFNNSGNLVVAQATGFVKGEVNRWPQLQELATSNDGLLKHPIWWPNVGAGDDVGGSQRMHFFAKSPDGSYVDIADQLGLAIPTPTRGIATGDADGDGKLDFALARQWAEPVFYHNDSPDTGAFIGLRLTHQPTAVSNPVQRGTLPVVGSPAVGAQVTVTTADGRRFISRVDGGSGHSGKRSTDVHIGLGADVSGPLKVVICWRERGGQLRKEELTMTTGWHDLNLDFLTKNTPTNER